MNAFPLTKACSVAGYVQVLKEIGAPVEAGLRRARLPVLLEECPAAWLPYERLRHFTADLADREGVPDLGFFEFSLQQVLAPTFRDPVLGAPTLHRALQVLPLVSNRQLTQFRAWLELAGEQARFCVALPLSQDIPGYAIGETRTLRLAEGVVRAFAGPDFLPTRVSLTSRARDLQFDLETAYQGVPVSTDQPCSAIEFPRALLCATGRSGATGPAVPPDLPFRGEPPAAGNLSESLEACLEPYVLDSGYPYIGLAADISGCSVRTLQRRLKDEQMTYAEIVDNVRCRMAMSQLRDTDATLDELARQLGYSEHAAFTRAFRRWTGTSPADYRALSLIQSG